jgi:hypothetical protein
MDANQARRRTDPDPMSVHEPASTSQAPKPFIYQPLDPDRDSDSIRLVLIHPYSKDDDLLSCTLIHVKFAEKPRYNALSYMWGDEAVKVDILLEGALFQVGQNLWDALHYLRSSGTLKLFWIDAICINQLDVEERNRQLPMMKWIYFRADTVVTWLGEKYSKYPMPTKFQTIQKAVTQASNGSSATLGIATVPGKSSALVLPEQVETILLSEEDTTGNWGRKKKDVSEKVRNEQALVKELRSDGYWDRLWIIQEIGRARKNIVCFGTSAMDWNAFIEMITPSKSSFDGPLRLDRLVKEKYTGSLTLQKLLQDHRKASCKEPRDKIYGLIGLAADAFQFPMDYNKSLLEVWTDTMVFLNAQGSLRECDIIPFGSLVKSLLIGNNPEPLQQALRPHELQLDSLYIIGETKSDWVFELPAVVVGCIREVGPSTDEIISSLRKADGWAGEVQQNFKDEIGEAHRENDTLMRYILEMDEARLSAMCFSHVSDVRWLCSFKNRSLLDLYNDTIQAKQGDTQPTTTGSSKPFLVANCARNKTPWKMGIASSLAQPGDLICWVPGIERALILRVSFEQEKKTRRIYLQGFGTALFTDDFDSADKARHAGRLKTFSENEKLDIYIDAATIYVLLA